MIANGGHFDAGDHGSNFFSVDALFSDANEPANNSSGGSTEFYAVYRGQSSPEKFLGINTKIGPFQAINFEFGGDVEGENSAFVRKKGARGRSELPPQRAGRLPGYRRPCLP
jgi:hypothetical protein